MSVLNTIRQTIREIIDLSSKSAILADYKSKIFCQQYNEINKLASDNANIAEVFLRDLSIDHGIKNERLYTTISSLASSSANQIEFAKNFKQINYDRLNVNLKPAYWELFQNLGRIPEGVSTLVKLREDLLNTLEQNRNASDMEDLKIMNSVLKNLLNLYFTAGLLNIQKITWDSPAALVEKVAHYERVHQIRSLSDLKNRLSSSRRCFIYTHSSMPNEPLVILHIALTDNICSNIADLIGPKDPKKRELNENEYTNAIFYSITLCQKGLQQVDLGNSLIKSCVRLLMEEFPNLRLFHTLSPIPKFKEWLDSKLFISSKGADFFHKLLDIKEIQVLSEYFQVESNNPSVLLDKIKSYLNSHQYKIDLKERLDEPLDTKKIIFNHLIEKILVRSCSYYLFYEKKNGYAFNSVGNFHIKNGAEIYRVNYAGDVSDKGIKSSYGLMVNYGYYLNDLEANCVNYLIDKKIEISEIVEQQLENFLINSKL